jgi:hypothetical protein
MQPLGKLLRLKPKVKGLLGERELRRRVGRLAALLGQGDPTRLSSQATKAAAAKAAADDHRSVNSLIEKLLTDHPDT